MQRYTVIAAVSNMKYMEIRPIRYMPCIFTRVVS